MSLLRIATANLLEMATTLTGPPVLVGSLGRLKDRNIKKAVQVGSESIIGGTKTTDGSYTVHTFTESGSLIVATAAPISATVLVIGGGGGGGYAGGGGAGGMIETTIDITGIMPVVVGAGGADPGTGVSTSGGASSIGAVIAAGGGGVPGKSGGSGGGEYAGDPGGAGISGQGNNGGNGPLVAPYPSGGGGGKGAVGANGSGSTSGAGGAGASSSISGAATNYAGGGGGGAAVGSTAGAGGTGGGGSGSATGNGTSGTANTGGGGGGKVHSGSYLGGGGGAGVVIVRYLTADLSASATRAYTATGGISAESVSALIIAAGHNIGGLAYTLAKSANGTDWTTVSNGTLAAGTGTQVIEFAATTGAYWKFSLPDSTDAVLTEIFLTNIRTLTRNPARPSGALETDYNVEVTETHSGNPRYIDRGDDRRVREYKFRLGATETDAIKAEIDALGGKRDFFLCDHTSAWMFGNLTAPMAPAETTSATRAFDFKFKESA